MSEKTCGTCKHWGAADETGDYRQCQAMYHDSTQEACHERPSEETAQKHPNLLEWWEEAHSHPAVLQDGSGYMAVMLCRTEFGCVLHEPAGTTE